MNVYQIEEKLHYKNGGSPLLWLQTLPLLFMGEIALYDEKGWFLNALFYILPPLVIALLIRMTIDTHQDRKKEVEEACTLSDAFMATEATLDRFSPDESELAVVKTKGLSCGLGKAADAEIG